MVKMLKVQEKLVIHTRLWLILTILWMVVMFILSTPPFSGKRITNITDKISTGLDFDFIAHFIVYFILGFLTSGAIKTNFTWKNKFLITVLVCILFASSDELHQYFEPERKCRMIDVITDCVSSILGILFFYVGILFRKIN